MNKTLLSVCTGAVLLLAGCRTPEMLNNSGTSFAKNQLQSFVDEGKLNGIICVYYKDGRQETSCIGYKDLAKTNPITIDDHFMQCSQTKGFCGVCIAMLVEEGKLDLDAPVSDFLPEFKTLWVEQGTQGDVKTIVKAKNALTVRMCLNHTGGFPFEMPNFQAMGGWSRRMPLRSVAATVAAMPLKFEPGTKASYSNVGIDIGAAVVEKITGMRWEEFLKQRVLDPLGMTESTFWPTEKQLKNRIQLCNVVKDKPTTQIECNASMQTPYGDDRVFASAGAGLWTTTRDQYKFYKMLMNLGVGDNGVRLLKEETVKSLLAVSSRPAGMGGYSLGLAAPETDKEDAVFGHGGAWSTSCNVNWHKRELTMFVMQICGNGTGVISNAARKGAQEFFQNTVDSSKVDEYTGRMK